MVIDKTKSFQYNIPTKTRMKHGKISSENRDRTPFNMEKKEFEECINLYSNIGSNVSISIDTLRFFNNNDSVQLVGKYAPAFTSFLIDSIWRSSIVSLNAFFSNDERGFKKLFDYIKANHNKIFTGKFYDIIDYGDEKKEVKIDFNIKTIFELIKECQDKISDHETLLKKLNAFRDNSYAHFSKDKNGSLNDIDKFSCGYLGYGCILL